MMLADLEPEGWAIVITAAIGAFFMGLTTLLTQLLQMYLSYKRSVAADARVAVVESKADAIKGAVDSVTAGQGARLIQLVHEVDRVKGVVNEVKSGVSEVKSQLEAGKESREKE